MSAKRRKAVYIVLMSLVAIMGLYALSLYSYLLFHVVVELFSIIVAISVFTVSENSKAFHRDGYLKFMGRAYFCIAMIDLVHTLAYKGMNLIPGYDANLPTQLWVAARYLEAGTLLITPFLLDRQPRKGVWGVYGMISTLLVVAVFAGWFPDCYIENSGLTPFKTISEYIISAVLLISLVVLGKRGNAKGLDARFLRLVSWSIVLTIASEISFTLYVGVYDLPNLIGHILKLCSFVLLYIGVVRNGLMQPYTVIFGRLTDREEALRKANDELEARVAERTRELEETMQALKKSESCLQRAEAMAHIGHWEIDREMLLAEGSDEVHRIVGRPRGSRLADQPLMQVVPEERQLLKALLRRQPRTIRHEHDWTVLRPDGSHRIIHVMTEPVDPGTYNPRYLFCTVHDVTEERKTQKELELYREHLEELVRERTQQLAATTHRLEKARMLETVGQLAGGMAHWFNNLLTVVIGYAELLSERLKDDPEEKKMAQTILENGERAAALVKEIVAFGQKQFLLQETTDPNWLIRDLMNALTETAGSKATVSLDLQQRMPDLHIEAYQLRDILLDMVQNAAEAMTGPNTGLIDISTHECSIEESREPSEELETGHYGCIVVRDNGHGMDASTLDHVFEPFFTTKSPATNTAMSLSAAYGTVRQLGGTITIESEQGKGTTFAIYLPAIDGTALPAAAPTSTPTRNQTS